jgi:proteasome accessory factor C
MAEMTAAERLDRTLAIVPWVANRPGGTATFAEISERFSIDPEALRDCLVITSMVGVHPYTPDLLINAIVESDSVTIDLPEYFRRPLRLTAEQTFALLTSAKALLSVPGADQTSALARGLAKVLTALGEGSETAVDVGVDTASEVVIEQLRESIDRNLAVELTYYSYGRDDTGSRVIDPWSIHSEGGLWYLRGRCHTNDAERVFRIDRIRSVSLTDRRSQPPDPLPPFRLFDSSDALGHIVLRLSRDDRWVIEYYPTESVQEEVDGSLVVEMAIGSVAWLERLLLRLGPEAMILDATAGLETTGTTAARRILSIYGE